MKYSILILVHFFFLINLNEANSQIKGVGTTIKKGEGYYIDTAGLKNEGLIKVHCVSGSGTAKEPKVDLAYIDFRRDKNDNWQSISIDQFQKVVIEQDTFIRYPDGQIYVDGLGKKDDQWVYYDWELYHLEISGDLKYMTTYYLVAGERNKKEYVYLDGKSFPFYWIVNTSSEQFKKDVLSWIEDKDEVYSKYKDYKPYQIGRKIKEIIEEYNEQ
jgi:hypothetical protein